MSPHDPTPVTEVEGSISEERFAREFARANRPLVIRGGAKAWPALERWTPDYLSTIHGEVPVQAHSGHPPGPRIEIGHFGRLAAEERSEDLDLETFLERCVQAGPNEEVYARGLRLPLLPWLGRDFKPLDFVDPSKISGHTLWLGTNTHTLGHFHPAQQAVLTQVHGTKEVLLYGPRELKAVSLFPWWTTSFNRSQVNFAHEDLSPFPALSRVRGQRCVLEPGDMLFIPVHWLHAPSGRGLCMSLTAWWPAPLREWAFPRPGLRSLFWIGGKEVVDAGYYYAHCARQRVRRQPSEPRLRRVGWHSLRSRLAGAMARS